MIAKWIQRGFAAVVLLVLVAAVGLVSLLYLLTARVEGAYFDSDGFSIHYTVDGVADGEPVILVHGLGANIDLNWRRAGVISRIGRDYRVIAFDLRGHGLSQRSHDPTDYGYEMVADVFRLMDHLGLESAHIVGYSLGGFIGLKAASDKPDRVRSLSVAAAGWRDPYCDEPFLKPYRSPHLQVRPIQEARVPDDPSFEGWGGGRPFVVRLADPFRDYVGERIGDKDAFRAARSDGSVLALGVPAEEVQHIPVPTALFIGDDDGLLWYAHDLRDMMPGIAYFEYPGLNHLTLGMSSRFRRDLHAFLLQQEAS